LISERGVAQPGEGRRESERRAFLDAAGLDAARREPLAGDASTRAYERLYPVSGPSLILMDQPPALETQPCPPDATEAERAGLGFNALYRLAAGRVDAFIACAAHLRGLGLSAPEVVAADPAAGLAVLEDLGDDLYAVAIAAGTDEAPLYDSAVDVLLRLHQAPPPPVLEGDGVSWPLLTYDAVALRTASELFVEWLPRLDPRLAFDDAALADWRALWAPVLARGEALASVFCHRDFHAENLIWLPGRVGAARTGLLDFQDAVRAHPAWDLSMLLHDARRDVSPEREAAVLARYLAARLDLDPGAFLADFHNLGALNIVRILGIFARLVARDGKPRYRALIPRLWRYLDRCLADPATAALGDWLAAHVPAGARA
jgi:aminoglycoside/choline kinase family phosphotransferase